MKKLAWYIFPGERKGVGANRLSSVQQQLPERADLVKFDILLAAK